MGYDIAVPFKIGLFSLAVTILVIYFTQLIFYLKKNKLTVKGALFILLHMIIMLGGLLLTGYARILR